MHLPKSLVVFMVALLATSFLPLPAEAGTRAVTRVLLVGDSWAEFMWVNRTLQDVFTDNGRADVIEEGSATAIGGSTAAEWAQPGFLQLITDALDATYTIDTVQLTLGGNDFLAGQSGGGWHTGISQQDQDALTAQALADINTVLDHILAYDPGIEVVISLYDYTNFEDSLFFPGCSSTWDNLGQPTPRQINEANLAFQNAIVADIASRSRVTLVDHNGLMQFTYGFPGEGIQPGDLLPPGDLDRPSPIQAMFLGADCFHLDSDGYYVLGQNLWDNYYRARLNSSIFTDGFESGDTLSWSLSAP